MANDATFLQHTCELAAMRAVVRTGRARRFHLYDTHAGAPSQQLDPDGSSRNLLQRNLNLAAAQSKPLPPGTVLQR
ncbi:MAG: hypothetical protein ACOC1F_13120, partial [Myxococcota bacterium]